MYVNVAVSPPDKSATSVEDRVAVAVPSLWHLRRTQSRSPALPVYHWSPSRTATASTHRLPYAVLWARQLWKVTVGRQGKENGAPFP